MSTTRLALAQLVHWPKKEASYGNGISDGEAGSLVTRWRGERITPKPTVAYSEQTGSGHEWKSGDHRLINAWDTGVQRAFDLDVYMASHVIGFGLGSVSSSSAGSGGYRHVFKPLDLSANAPQLPSTSWVESYPDEGVKQKCFGMVCGGFTLSGSKGQWCQGSADWRGNGKVDRTTSQTVPTETIATPIRFTSFQAATGGASGAKNFASRLNSFNFAWNNNLLSDDGYLANATQWNDGPLRSRLEFGVRDGGVLELVIDAQRSADDEIDELLASTTWDDTTLTMRGKLVGGAVYEEVKIVIPQAKVDDVTEGWDGPKGTRTLLLTPVYDSDLGAPLKIETVDAVSARLTAAA